MKRLVTTSKVKAIVGLLCLCAMAVLAIPGEAYAFDAKDVPVLMYHKVDDVTPTIYWVSTDNFRDQMFLLHDLGYETVDFEDLYAHIMNVTELPAKPIILTFDDNYQNAYTHAFPVMQEFNDPNFFGVTHVITDYIGDDEATRQNNAWDQPVEPNTMNLIWPEISELYGAGWAVEAHSRTHAHLSGLTYEQKEYEAGSAEVIATKLGIPEPNFYSYPFGEYDTDLITILQAKGYLGGMDASGGIENTSTTNLFHIKRIGIMRDDTLAGFASKIGESVPALPTLTVNVVGNGYVDINPDQPYYDYGTVVTLTAIPEPPYEFDSWSGDLTDSNNPETVTMDTDKTVTATYVFNDTDPPEPNVMTWASEPNATGTTSISMTATTATDDSTPVYYYFECTTDGDANSTWQTSPIYVAEGLNPSTQYTFRVKARDSSLAQNETAWSSAESATTDTPPPALPWSDDFETGGGDFDPDKGWTTLGNATVSTDAAYTDTYGALLKGIAEIEKALNTTGFTTIHVKYVRATNGKMDTGEYLYVEWFDGATWHELEATQDASWVSKDMICSSGADNNPDFKIRFRTNANNAAEHAYIDDVEITGQVVVPQRALSTSSGPGGSVATPGQPGPYYYDHGSEVNIVATPDTGYHFVNWTGDTTAIANVNADSTTITMDADYSVTANFAIDQMAIFGYVTEPDANIPVEGVFADANNGGSSDTTDANGYYELTVNYGWSGTVTPEKEGYTFDPNSDVYTNVTRDYNDMDYVAELSTFVISGYILESDDITPISDVNVSAEDGGGYYTSKYGGGAAMTDANGYYEAVVDYNWSGKVTPAKYAYAFEPNSMDYNDVKADFNSQDYIGTLLTYTITGYIKNSCAVPIAGVVVDANNDGGSDISDANGYYEVWVDYKWSGTVMPSKVHYTFDPNSGAYADVLEDQVGQDYDADNIYDLDCDGLIGFGDLGVICENWLDGPDLPGDFYKDEDDIVSFLDFAEFANVWGD